MTYHDDDAKPPANGDRRDGLDAHDGSGPEWDQPRVYELPPEDLPALHGQPPYAQPAFGQAPYGPPPYSSLTPEAAWAPPEAHAAWSIAGPATLAAPPTPRRRWPIVLATVLTVLLLVVGGGSVFAYRALRSSGPKAAQALPADSFALITVDLDPAASQKIDAVRFARRIPDVGASFGEKTDPKLSIFNAFARAGQLPSGLSYDRDIKPWVGDRIALASRPAVIEGSDADLLIAVQTKDAKQAESAVRRIAATTDQPVGVADGNGYVLIADTQAVADRAVADAKNGSLADRREYKSDMSALGQLGVASGWIDVKAALDATNVGNGTPGSPFLGALSRGGAPGKNALRTSFTVRFTASAAELVVRVNTGQAVSPAPPGGPQLIAGLPEDTAAAVEFRGARGAFGQGWNQALKSATSGQRAEVESLGDELGLRLPDDIDTFLGTDLVAGLDLSRGLDTPSVGVRSKTDPAAAAKAIDSLEQALAAQQMSPGLRMLKTPDGVVVANSDSYAAAMASTSGKRLGDSAAFRTAVPDQAGATAIGYVNLDVLSAAAQKAGASSDDLKALHAFKAVGLSVSTTDGSTLLRVRLVAH
ncbi:MAG: hypothetical protein JWN95_282 [Frankiales bacterium]|nr:hypothetical protein [Frankiales bacterium]